MSSACTAVSVNLLLIAERRERLIAVAGHQLSRLPCGACNGLPAGADGRVVVFRARRFAVRAAVRVPLILHRLTVRPSCWLRRSAVVAGDPATRAASGPGSRVAGQLLGGERRTQRIRSAAAWGWLLNSWHPADAAAGTEPAHGVAHRSRPRFRRLERPIAAARRRTVPRHHASSTFSRVLAVLPAVDVLAGEGTGSPGAGSACWAKRTGNPPVSRTCVRTDVPDEAVMVLWNQPAFRLHRAEEAGHTTGSGRRRRHHRRQPPRRSAWRRALILKSASTTTRCAPTLRRAAHRHLPPSGWRPEIARAQKPPRPSPGTDREGRP